MLAMTSLHAALAFTGVVTCSSAVDVAATAVGGTAILTQAAPL